MVKQRTNYSPEQKVGILKERLLEKAPVSRERLASAGILIFHVSTSVVHFIIY